MRALMAGILLVTATFVAAASPVTVCYTNDLHVRLDRLASLSRAIEDVRATGDPMVWLDAGDGWHDYRRPLPAVWGSDSMVAWMNDAGLAAMALGNHETYLGPQRLSDRIADAGFPVLAANWRSDDPRLAVRSSVTLRVGEISMQVIGLLTPEFLPVYAYPLVTVLDPVSVVRDAIERQDAAVDLVVVLAHVSLDRACRIARDVPDIDLFLTGHSHERTDEPIVIGHTIIVQSGAFGEALGRLQLDISDDDVTVVSNELIPMETAPADDRAGAVKLLSVAVALLVAAAVWWF